MSCHNSCIFLYSNLTGKIYITKRSLLAPLSYLYTYSFCCVARYHNKKDTTKLGQRIKFLRLEKGMYLEDISEMTGFARSTIRAIENGSETNMTHFFEIAKAIGVQPVEILNFMIELRPRFKISAKRKEQLRVTQKVKLLAENGYFKIGRQVADVVLALKEEYKTKASSAKVSGILIRLSNDNTLKSFRSGRKNVYIIKPKK